jgi:hypothetical protein
MKTSRVFIVGISTLLFSAAVSFGEIKITVDCNSNDDATTQFKFKNVPSPATNDAAAKAKFTIVSGEADNNSGDISVLNDGNLPDEENEPDANFFFASDSQGGRIQVDLGRVIAIKQVNSYSWHPNTRGPQVYKLYASDGKADGFNDKPDNSVNPEKAGWKLIAKVDTRPKNEAGGGQYGVSISDSDGTIGKYRYLLFDCSPTELDDANGNTFYSEIDVVGADDHKADAAAVITNAVQVPLASSFNTRGIYINEEKFSDGLDGSGCACSAELLGASQVWDGATFKMGSPGVSNVVTAAGQSIPLPAGKFSSLRLLMLAVNGNQESQNFLMTYTNSAVETNTQSISDWFTPMSYPGESQAVTMDHRDNSDGTSSSDQTFYIYAYSFSLNNTNVLKTITLPDNSNVKVFALTLVP